MGLRKRLHSFQRMTQNGSALPPLTQPQWRRGITHERDVSQKKQTRER
ncbi:unnamed protein product [Gulo gulo]|uniref:Uncharacterized protein n=1 Tax=Gulo gulo TaxID=48420 RepID=A0A9X9MDT2_GULGU|nr:unnamed protein product [Gulo gulo]